MLSSSSQGWIEIRVNTLFALVLIATACGGQATGTSPTSTPSTTNIGPSTTTTSLAIPATSEEVAVAFFEAWRAGDRPAMETLAEAEALAQADDLANLAGETWQFERCEGAAGTVFCVWASETDQLAVGVRNIEEPHLVTSVSLVDV